MTKKGWAKPELIVLMRSKPGEAVLAACKSGEAGGVGGGNDNSNLQCWYFTGGPCNGVCFDGAHS